MATDAEIRAWAKSRELKVSDRGAIGARVRGEYNAAHGITDGPQPLPSPSEIAEDLGIIEPEESRVSPGGQVPGPATPTEPGGEAGPEPDEPPPHARREWRQRTRKPRKPTATPQRILAGVRQDINAKVMFALQVPGTIWQARDPLCGGVFVQQIPDTADAFTDIICDSPDLIAFFTGPGGAFMKYLKLGAALMPVVQVAMAHHVYHSIEIGAGDEAEPETAQYAA